MHHNVYVNGLVRKFVEWVKILSFPSTDGLLQKSYKKLWKGMWQLPDQN